MNQSTPSVFPGVTAANGERYYITREPAPMPRPSWWQSRWQICDRWLSNHGVIENFWHFGAAERRVRCLNRPNALDCSHSAADDSYAERWALAS